ncbi:MAG: FeoB-associated Cys-rich membrane protein [Clostridia bacterium]|nr:FeoB-associated Cys-rich membrane protein [Clostridia bacterium]
MNLPTILLLIVIAVLAVFAVRTIRRKKLLSTCGGDCSRCAAGCQNRKP